MSITWLTATATPHGLDEPEEMHLQHREDWADDKLGAYVQLKCAWNQRHGVMANLLENARAWPYHAGSLMFAANGSISPFTGQAGTRFGSGYSYDHALLTVNFASLQLAEGAEPGEVTIFSESIEPSLEFLTIAPEGFYWHASDHSEANKLLPEEAPGKQVYGLDYCVTFYKLRSIPAAALTLIGKVNHEVIISPSLGLTFPIESLLFAPPKISRNVTFGGDNSYTMNCRYSCRPTGWNKFWRKKVKDWVSMYDSEGDEYKNFEPGDFAGMVP